MISVSVCMAVYNGEEYLPEQLGSILIQLQQDDELIIVDDASDDGSTNIIESYGDKRIKLTKLTKNIGHIKAFEMAISYASKSVILLSDQDDIWPSGRIAALVEPLVRNKATCIVGNQSRINCNGHQVKSEFFPTKLEGVRSSIADIGQIFLGATPYFGCCMAFNAELKKIALPFPRSIESHDLWIACCAAIVGVNHSTQKIVTYRRVHGSNLSIIQRPLLRKLRSRILFLHHILIIGTRLIKKVSKC